MNEVAGLNYPTPKLNVFVARDFRFQSGTTMPSLNIHYATIGEPTGIPILILHGTTGSGVGLLNAQFAGELFGLGQPLDASKYFIILPDAIGAGGSSKPSDGLRSAFPAYNYNDMVAAQYQLITRHLGITRLRAVIGHSMGGMQTWLWGQQHPDLMDLLVPMASLPIAMGGRNWLMRRLLIESIRRDPAWNSGNYAEQPPSLKLASIFFANACNGGDQALQKNAPNADTGDAWIEKKFIAPFVGDANDHLYQWESSRDYDPSAHLERIRARVLIINSADDERNPLSLATGVMDAAIKRIHHAKLLLIPASADTAGHNTTLQARFWKHALAQALAQQ